MKTLKHLSCLSLAAILFLLHGCKEKQDPPTVEFSTQGGGCQAPCPITFSNETKGADDYDWDFGDGQHATDENPAHTYNEGGTFVVTLTASNEDHSGSKAHEVFIQLSAQASVTASFTMTNNNCIGPCTVNFTSTSTNATTYDWDFGDGSTHSTEANPTHYYSANGNYTVTLTASNSIDSDQAQNTASIVTDPCAGINCLHGGVCVTGYCDCPTGWTGYNCGDEDYPTAVKVTKIVLTSYIDTDVSGNPWDASDGPDLYININEGTGAINYQLTEVETNNTSGTATFTSGFPYTISDPYTDWAVSLWDYDATGGDDLMGGYYFTPDNETGFPTTITLYGGSGTINMKLYVTWVF